MRSLTDSEETFFAWLSGGFIASLLSLVWLIEYDKGYGEWCWGGCCVWIILAIIFKSIKNEQKVATNLISEGKETPKHLSTTKCAGCGVIIKSKSIGERVAKGTAGTIGGGYGGMVVGTIIAPGIGTLIGGAIGASVIGSEGSSKSPNICNNCCYTCELRKSQCICRSLDYDNYEDQEDGQ